MIKTFVRINKITLFNIYKTYFFIDEIYTLYIIYMEASEPEWVNPISNIIGVNSLRLGSLQLLLSLLYDFKYLLKKIFYDNFCVDFDMH